jgi:hypothetical protein
MGSVPWDCDVLVTASQKAECSGIATHLHVLLSSLLPLLGHGAWPDGAGEHARESEHGKGRADDTDGQEEDLAALIRRRRSSRTVGTEGDEVCYVFVSEWPWTMLLTRSASLSRRAHRCRGPTLVARRKHPARHSTTRRTTTSAREVYAPAFFSCMVNSFQSSFMRSLSDIHKSACSCGGMSSHRFSMLARVGLEMACAWRVCWIWQTAEAARGTAVRVAVEGMTIAELLAALAREERNMTAAEWRVSRKCKGKGDASRRGTCSCQWVGGDDGRTSALGGFAKMRLPELAKPTAHEPMELHT